METFLIKIKDMLSRCVPRSLPDVESAAGNFLENHATTRAAYHVRLPECLKMHDPSTVTQSFSRKIPVALSCFKQCSSSLVRKGVCKSVAISNSGFSLVEILIAMTLFSLFSVSVFYLSLDTLQRDTRIELESQALRYAEEGLEATRNMRDRNFFLLTNGDHGLRFSNDAWSFIEAPEDIDGFFDRTVTIYDVYRDVNEDIITDGGTFDPETKLVTSQVTWTSGIVPKSVILRTYLTNWTGDDWMQTTCSELNSGTFDLTEPIETLSPPTDNCALTLSLTETQSAFFSSADIGDHGNDVYVEGNYAYVASNKSQEGLVIVNVSDPSHPTIASRLDIGNKGRYIVKDGNYVYVGMQKVSQTNAGLAIVDVTNPSNPIRRSTVNVGGDGNLPAINGNYLYMGADSSEKLKVVNITNKSSPSVIASLDLDTEVYVVHLRNGYAYLGTEDDSHGFMVLSISNPASPSLVTSLNVGEEVNTITSNGLFAYLGTEESDDSLQVVNISDPTHPILTSSLDVEGEIQDISILDDYLYATLNKIDDSLVAVNIVDPVNPQVLYNIDVHAKGTGVYAYGNYIYLAVNTSNPGLIILGTTETSYLSSGSYISQSLDTGSEETRYNFIEWDHLEVPGGSVQFQIRTASSVELLESAIWVGSDGTNSTYYETSRTPIILDPERSGQRYAQFRAFINSDGASAPLIESVRLNYTP